MSKRKFKSGDFVRVRDDLKSVQDYWTCGPMCKEDWKLQNMGRIVARARRNRRLVVRHWDAWRRMYRIETVRGLDAGLYRSNELEHVEEETK